MAFSYIPVASRLHDPAKLSLLLAGHEKALGSLGGHRVDGAVADREEVDFWLIQTGGVEAEIIRRYRSRVQQGRGGPMLLIAHPAHNSLSAALEILAQVQQEGGCGRIYLLRGPEDAVTLDAIRQTARCLEANRKLAEDRLGIIGESSDWLVASSHRPEVLTTRLGLRVIPLTMADLRSQMEFHSIPADGPEFDLWKPSAADRGLRREEFARAAGIYRGLRALIREYRLTALTLRCFDLLQEEGLTACVALSRLADEGIAAGCEGDIPSVVLLRWLWHLTGKAGWMANVADVDVAAGELVLAHCTVPLSLTRAYRLSTHFESGRSVGIVGLLPIGPGTVLRLGGPRLERWWGAEGMVVPHRYRNDLCRTQARMKLPPAALAQWLETPLGNHLVWVPGHSLALFREALELNRASRPDLPVAATGPKG